MSFTLVNAVADKVKSTADHITIASGTLGAVAAGDILLVWVGDNSIASGANLADITWGSLAYGDFTVTNGGIAFTFANSQLIGYYSRIAAGGTNALTVQYDGNTTLCVGAMVLRGLSVADAYKEGTGNSTTPSSGATATLISATEVQIAALLKEGPVEDTTGTWDNSLTSAIAATGTTGGVASANRTIEVAYRELSATTAVTSSKSGITQRTWGMITQTFVVAPAAAGATVPSGLSIGMRIGL